MKQQIESTGHKLKVGDVFLQNGKEMVVWFLNDSRAAVAPMNSQIEHKLKEKEDGTTRIQFKANDSENISPNSEVRIVRRLGREGLAKHIDNKTNSNSTMKKDKTASKSGKKGTKGPRLGRIGGYKGHSVTSVIRAFGKAGWSAAEAREFFKREGLAVSDTTISIQLNAGRKGAGGDPAKLDNLAALRPKVKDVASSKKSDKSGKKDKAAGKNADKAKKKVKKTAPEPEAEEPEAEAEEGGDDAAE